MYKSVLCFLIFGVIVGEHLINGDLLSVWSDSWMGCIVPLLSQASITRDTLLSWGVAVNLVDVVYVEKAKDRL